MPPGTTATSIPNGRTCCWRPPNAAGERLPWAYVLPKSAEDLLGMGRSFAKTTFLSAGNITHTPAYGNLIALGVLTAVQARNAPEQQIAEALAYREHDRPHRAVSDLLRRRPDHRPAHAPRPAASGSR